MASVDLPQDLQEARAALRVAASSTSNVLTRLIGDGALAYNESRNLMHALSLIADADRRVEFFRERAEGAMDRRFLD